MNGFESHDHHQLMGDDLAAYALGALEIEESSQLERHLADCESCRERLQWLRPAIDTLPASVEQRTPPDSLRTNLMAVVRPEAATVAEVDSTAVAPARPSWLARLRETILRPAVGVAVMIVLVAGVAIGYLARGEGPTTEVIRAPASELIRAEPTLAEVQVSATLERQGGNATLHVDQLPELESDEVYEVWFQRADVFEPRNTFVLGRDGTAEVAVPGPLAGGDAILVTSEPRPGSPQPTSDPILQAPLK